MSQLFDCFLHQQELLLLLYLNSVKKAPRKITKHKKKDRFCARGDDLYGFVPCGANQKMYQAQRKYGEN